MKRRYALFAMTSLLAVAIAVPAFGGPDNPVSEVMKSAKSTAKKALKKAKEANKAAKQAQKSADNAQLSADNAQSTADGAASAAATADSKAETAQSAADAAQATATVDPAIGTAATDPDVINDFNGTIEDMIIDIDTGDILHVVVNAAFAEGERLIPVPLRVFQWNAANEAFVLDADPARIQEAPFFQADAWPDTTTAGWDDEFKAFWQ